MADNLLFEGTLTFFVKHRNAEWAVDGDTYRFPEVRRAPLLVSAVKHADRTISIAMEGPFGGRFDFHHPMPPCDERGLQIGLSWIDHRVMLYLNGTCLETQQAKLTVH